ncbi:hypothetical protein [Burkholderia sp. PAMC 28687]|nr:hypothetical protein [Burkholderia sp. PAMC 28687]
MASTLDTRAACINAVWPFSSRASVSLVGSRAQIVSAPEQCHE